MQQEQWKPVPGYEGLYEVSSLGRVKSLARKVGGRGGSERSLPERILAPHKIPSGYLQVALCKNSRTRVHRVHRLVASAFLGPAPMLNACRLDFIEPRYELAVVAHADADRTNNRVENLRYATTWENAQDRINHGRGRGETHGNAQLTDEIVLTIRRRFDAGEAIKSIAADYPWTKAHINNVARRHVWKHLP